MNGGVGTSVSISNHSLTHIHVTAASRARHCPLTREWTTRTEMRGERPPQYLKSALERAACLVSVATRSSTLVSRSHTHTHTQTHIKHKHMREAAPESAGSRVCGGEQHARSWKERSVLPEVWLEARVKPCVRAYSLERQCLIGGRTGLSSFPMGTIPHGIYNNNGHGRGRRVDLYLPGRFSFLYFFLSPDAPPSLSSCPSFASSSRRTVESKVQRRFASTERELYVEGTLYPRDSRRNYDSLGPTLLFWIPSLLSFLLGSAVPCC